MRSKSPKVVNPKREALQQYWHEGGSTGIYARATLRTLQFSSAIIAIGIYGSTLHQRTQASNPITNEIYALVVGLLSVFTLGFHCLFTIKRVPFVLWDFVICVLWAALAGVYGTIYLAGAGELAPEDAVKSLDAMKAGAAFDLLSMALWMLSSLQGCVWCCRARRFTRKTDVAEMGEVEAASRPDETYASSALPAYSSASSDETTLYASSVAEEKDERLYEGKLMSEEKKPAKGAAE